MAREDGGERRWRGRWRDRLKERTKKDKERTSEREENGSLSVHSINSGSSKNGFCLEECCRVLYG